MSKKDMIGTRFDVTAALFAEFNRAQLGCITANMRAIGFRTDETQMTVTFFYANAPSETDKEAALDIIDTLDEGGQVPQSKKLRHAFVQTNAPQLQLGEQDALTFLRKEDA